MKSNQALNLTHGEKVLHAVIVFFLIFMSVIFLYPMLYVISMSISDSLLVARRDIILLPKGVTFDAYQMILKKPTIWNSYYNTIWYTFFGTIINVTLTMLFAYPLSRQNFVARKPLTVMMAITMWFSGGMIPTFILVKNLGMYNTRWVMILLGAIAPWNVMITKTFLAENIPESLVEAAHIDGCNDLKLFSSIVLPLSKAILAVNVLFYAVGHWNNYFRALLYLSDAKLQPLQIFLRSILFEAQMLADSGGSDSSSGLYLLSEKLKYAVIVFGMLPIMCVYPFLQKYFVKGMMIGAVKG